MQDKNKRSSNTNWTDAAFQILESAASIVAEKFSDKDVYSDPDLTKEFLMYKLSGHEREVFAVMFLNSQNELIEYNELFSGTINSAAVYPREVVKHALKVNASAVIFAHNHPSGKSEPSEADKQITTRLNAALSLVDIRVLDHIVVGRTPVSFAERGLI